MVAKGNCDVSCTNPSIMLAPIVMLLDVESSCSISISDTTSSPWAWLSKSGSCQIIILFSSVSLLYCALCSASFPSDSLPALFDLLKIALHLYPMVALHHSTKYCCSHWSSKLLEREKYLPLLPDHMHVCWISYLLELFTSFLLVSIVCLATPQFPSR